MKKVLFVLAAVVLMAAGCSGSTTTSVTPSPSGDGNPSSTNTDVNSVDDAVNVMISASNNEQAIVSGEEDSDLATSDSAELDSLMEVSNGY